VNELPRKIPDGISVEKFLKLPAKSDEQRVREALEEEFGKKLYFRKTELLLEK